jgi:hypothetical protein
MNGIDVVALAICWREGPLKPPNRSFRNNNCGNLRSTNVLAHDPDGFDIYPDFIAGYEALADDLADKFQTGHNAHGLGPTSTILQLFQVYAPSEDGNDPNSYCMFVTAWVNQAMGKTLTPASQLSEIWTSPA